MADKTSKSKPVEIDALTSGVGGGRSFFGRKDELEQFKAELRNPRGSAIIVVGQQGMGKTMLLNRFMSVATTIDGLQCGAVRQEVTPSDTVDTVLGIFMDRAYEAANITEGSFEQTPQRLKQWRALLNVVKVGDLIMLLRRDPKRNTRDQFLDALDRISEKLPANKRAVFIIDPEKYLPPDCDQDWAIVIRRLPERIKLVFAQRPDDALADSTVISELTNIARIPYDNLDVLDERGFEDLVDSRAAECSMTASELKKVLTPYERHPYAVVAAVELLAAGVLPDQLPREPKPTAFAEAQWKQIKRGGQLRANGDLAIRLFRSYALLEVPVPDDLIEEVSGLSSAQRLSITADSFLGPLLRDEACLQRIYHAILIDHIVSMTPENETKAIHERAISAYRKRLSDMPPDGLAARRLALHVRAVDGDDAFVLCFVNECISKLRLIGLLDEIEALTAQAMTTITPGGEAQAAMYSSLGCVKRIRGDFDGAEEVLRMAIENNEKLNKLEALASDYGNLGNVMQESGNFDDAESMFRKSLEIEERLCHQEGIASSYISLGNILKEQVNLDEAEAMYRKALEISEKIGFLEGMAISYGNLGLIMRRRGNLDSADAMYKKALEIEKKLGRLEGMANQYGNLGVVMETRDDISGARELWTKSREMFVKLGAQHMVDKVQSAIDKLPE